MLLLALLLAAPGLGCAGTPAGDGRPPNAPEYAERTPPPSADGVVLDTPDRHAEVKDPEAAIAQIGQQAQLVERELRVARGKHATQTADCIDDKLSQIHAQERMGVDQSKVLADAKSSSDATREQQARVMIGVARDRAEQLAREADRCGARVSSGRSRVDVQVDRTQAASMNPMPVIPAR